MTDIVNFSSTSSGVNGWSSLSAYLECPARAHIAREAAIKQGDGTYSPWPEEGKPVPTMVGSIYGELTERWLRGEPASPRAQFQWNGQLLELSHPQTLAEATRLFDARTARGWDFGRVIATQVDVLIPASIFGIEVSGNLDLVVEHETGVWIGDLKTEGRTDANLRDKFSLRQQLWWYCLGYELKTGVKPVGCFIDLCIKNKEPKFERYEYEGITDQRFAWLRDSAMRVKSAMADQHPTPSLSACVPYGRKCSQLENGLCQLIK